MWHYVKRGPGASVFIAARLHNVDADTLGERLPGDSAVFPEHGEGLHRLRLTTLMATPMLENGADIRVKQVYLATHPGASLCGNPGRRSA